MAHATLGALPAELILRIGDFLAFEDRVQFSSIDTQTRRLFAASVFATIRFTNEEEDQESICRTLAAVGHHARALYYQCYLYADSEDDIIDDEEPDSDEDESEPKAASATEGRRSALPGFTSQLLAGEALRQPTRVIMEFIAEDDYWGESWGDHQEIGGVWLAEEIEDAEDIREAERAHPWRRIMAETWRALSKNRSIRQLEINELFPREVSSWSEPGWAVFLSRLDHLHLKLWANEPDTHDINPTVMRGYVNFQRRLWQYFFRHASELKRLRFCADAEGLCGTQGPVLDIGSCSMPLRAEHMEKLETLELEHCVIDMSLAEFLTSHGNTLKRFVLTECHARSSDLRVSNGLSWGLLFSALLASVPGLERFDVINSNVPLTEEELESYEGDSLDEAGNSENRTSTQSLAVQNVSGDHRKRFSYIYQDDKYCYTRSEVEINRQSWDDGSDQRSYDALMAVVRRNTRRDD